jgi:site-specific DNA-methyltransferase (adenine-specific)/adenine-specific DNA-methyltransferase
MPTLNWIGKDAVVKHHHEVPFHLLKDVPELSSGDPGAGNLVVRGDNLVGSRSDLRYLLFASIGIQFEFVDSDKL